MAVHDMIEIMSDDFHNFLSRIPAVSRRFARGRLIFEQGDPVDNLYCVDSGEVHLLRRQEDGSAFVLQRAGAGTILAEASLTTPRYHCSAVAIKESTVAAFQRKKVLDLIAGDKTAAMALVMHLGREVRTARLRAEMGLLRKVSDKLDAWLAWNDDALPQKGNWHHVAQEIGVSPEALYRELANRR